MVQTVAKLSHTPNALLYYPFLDDILKGKQFMDSIKKYVGDGEAQWILLGIINCL